MPESYTANSVCVIFCMSRNVLGILKGLVALHLFSSADLNLYYLCAINLAIMHAACCIIRKILIKKEEEEILKDEWSPRESHNYCHVILVWTSSWLYLQPTLQFARASYFPIQNMLHIVAFECFLKRIFGRLIFTMLSSCCLPSSRVRTLIIAAFYAI